MDDHRKRYEGIPRLDGRIHLMVPASIWMLRGHEHTPPGFGIAFLPILPSAFAVGAFLRYFRGLDELRRRIRLEAVAFSFLATCLISLTRAFQTECRAAALGCESGGAPADPAGGLGVGIAQRR